MDITTQALTKPRRSTTRTRRRHSIAAPPAAIRYQHPLVARLRNYAAVFGDFERPLLKAAHEINLIASIDDAAMFAKVAEAIRTGCNALDDIVSETRLPDEEVKRIYEYLLIEGDYEERPIGYNSGHGARPKGIFLKTDRAGNLPPGTLGNGRRLSHYENQFDSNDKDDD